MSVENNNANTQSSTNTHVHCAFACICTIWPFVWLFVWMTIFLLLFFFGKFAHIDSTDRTELFTIPLSMPNKRYKSFWNHRWWSWFYWCFCCCCFFNCLLSLFCFGLLKSKRIKKRWKNRTKNQKQQQQKTCVYSKMTSTWTWDARPKWSSRASFTSSTNKHWLQTST